MDCLDPALYFVPEGRWYCPKCAPPPGNDESDKIVSTHRVAQVVASFEQKSSDPTDAANKDSTKNISQRKSTEPFSGWSFDLKRLEKSHRAEKKHLDMQLRKRARDSDSARKKSKKRKFSALSRSADLEPSSPQSAIDLTDSDNEATDDKPPSSKAVLENAVAAFLRSSLKDPEHPRNVKRALLVILHFAQICQSEHVSQTFQVYDLF